MGYMCESIREKGEQKKHAVDKKNCANKDAQ